MQQTSDIQKAFDYNTYSYNEIMTEFAKNIFLNKFYLNRYYLLDESENVPFTKGSWIYKPESFCNDHYKIPHYALIVLQ